jgi:hypothetical protein
MFFYKQTNNKCLSVNLPTSGQVASSSSGILVVVRVTSVTSTSNGSLAESTETRRLLGVTGFSLTGDADLLLDGVPFCVFPGLLPGFGLIDDSSLVASLATVDGFCPCFLPRGGLGEDRLVDESSTADLAGLLL